MTRKSRKSERKRLSSCVLPAPKRNKISRSAPSAPIKHLFWQETHIPRLKSPAKPDKINTTPNYLGNVGSVKSITFDKAEAKRGRKRRRIGGDGLLSSFALIEGGIIEYSFSEAMAEILHEPDQFIWMSLSVQNKFSRKYELSLFENCIRYVNIGSTGFKSVDDWRQILGVTEGTYDQFKHLNQLVLKPAAKGVNAVSGITVEPEFEREKRRVARIKYNVRENEQMSLLEHRKHAQWRSRDVFGRAKAMGLKEVEIFYWLESKGEEYLDEVLDYVAEKKPKKNVSGYLADGLRKGWGVKSPAERSKEKEASKRALERQVEYDAKKVAERAEETLAVQFLTHQQVRIEALLKDISDQDLADITAEMSDDIAIPAVAQKWAAIGNDISRMVELPKMVHRTMFDRLKKSVLGRWGDEDDLDFEAYKKKLQEN